MNNLSIITILHQFDPKGDRIGGIGSYVFNFIKSAPAELEIRLVGLTTQSGPLYQWQDTTISGRRVKFCAVCRLADENSRSIVPVTLRYVFGLLMSRLRLEFSGPLFMQRSEYLIPFVGWRGKKFLMIHSDISRTLEPGGSDMLWAKFPRLFKILFKQLLKGFDRIFSVNRASIEYITTLAPSLTSRLGFSPTWADAQVFYPHSEESTFAKKAQLATELRINCLSKWLVFVGRLQKVKNVELLIEALALVDSSVLLVIGEGDCRGALEAYAEEKNLTSRIRFLGNLTKLDVADYLRCSDVYLSSSHFEGMSVALLEALQCGLLVVTTPTGESLGIIKNGLNGIVTENWDVDSFAGAVNKVIKYEVGADKHCINSARQYSGAVIIRELMNDMGMKVHD